MGIHEGSPRPDCQIVHRGGKIHYPSVPSIYDPSSREWGFRTFIANTCTLQLSLGCPHKTESIDRLEDEIHNLMSLPGPELKTGLVRKVKNIARQVDHINTRFLDANFFSRLLHINFFSLKSISSPVDKGKPTGAGASESVKNDSEVPDASIIIIAKDEKGQEDSQNELFHLSEKNVDGDGNADTRQQARPATTTTITATHSALDPQTERVNNTNANPEQNNTIDYMAKKKNKMEAFDSGDEGSQEALIDHAFARASPFSRYTSCLFGMFDCYNRALENEIEHASLVKGEDFTSKDLNWAWHFVTKIRKGYYGECLRVKTRDSFLRSHFSLTHADAHLYL